MFARQISNDHGHSLKSKSTSLSRAMQEDRNLPANAFTFNGVGAPTIGIAIMQQENGFQIQIGGSYLSPFHRDPAFFHKIDGGQCVVRRMGLIDVDKVRFPCVTRPTVDGVYYVMVKTSIKNVQHLIHFHTDVEVHNGAKIIRYDWVAKTCLVEMPKGSYINVFYEDGMVRRLEVGDEGIAEVRLPLEVQAKYRVALAVSNLDKFHADTKLEKDKRIKSVDRWYHQLADTLKVGARFIENERDQIYQIFLGAAKSGDLRPKVYDHIMAVLGSARFASELMIAYTAQGVGAAIDEAHDIERHRGPKEDRRQKLAARSARDKALRSDMKGAKLHDDSHISKKKGKKDKK